MRSPLNRDVSKHAAALNPARRIRTARSILQRRFFPAAILAATMAFSALPSHAQQNMFWRSTGGGAFQDAANWSALEGFTQPATGADIEAGMPDPTRRAVFELGSNGNVTFSGNATTADAQVLKGTATFSLGGATWNTGTTLSILAPFSSGATPITASASIIGGTVNTGTLFVGGGDNGNVATLSLSGVTLSSSGFQVAQSATGTLNLTNASSLFTTPVSLSGVGIGGQVGSNGTVNISGGSTWTIGANGTLQVAGLSNGTLNVINGTVTAARMNVASNSTSVGFAYITGGSSLLNISDGINVGSGGNGTMNITAGGHVTSLAGSFGGVGNFNGSTGSVTIDGAGSTWTAGSLNIGTNGGPPSNGRITVSNGGLLNALSNLTIQGGGSVDVQSGSNLTASAVQVQSGGSATFSGTVTTGTVTVDGIGSVIQQNGNGVTIDNGAGIGTLNITNGGQYHGAPIMGISNSGIGVANVAVSGNGSSWNLGAPYILGAGGGLSTTIVQQGALMAAMDLFIGSGSNGVLEIWHNGSSITSTGSIYIGGTQSAPSAAGVTGRMSVYNGASASIAGELKVWDGGRAEAAGGTIFAGSINVAGGTVLESGGQFSSSGTLTISRGGLYQTSGEVTFGAGGFSGGSITGANSRILADFVNVKTGASLTLNGGSMPQNLELGGGTIIAITDLVLSPDRQFSGFGNITGNVRLSDGELSAQGGAISVSGSIGGHGLVTGNVTFASLAATDGDVFIGGGSPPLNLGAQRVRCVSTAPVQIYTQVNLGGASLISPSGFLFGGSQVYGYGDITGNVNAQTELHAQPSQTLTIHGNVDMQGGNLNAGDTGSAVNVTGSVGGRGLLIGNVTYGSLAPATGTVTVSGAPVNVADKPIRFISSGPVQIQTNLTLGGAQLTSPSGFSISSGTVLAGNGKLFGAVHNGGTISPDGGTSLVGTLEIHGDFDNSPSGTVHFDIAGTGPGQYDQIIVKGNAIFDGTLELNFFNGFAPHTGDTYNFFIDDFSGSFSGVNVNGLAPGFAYNLAGGPTGFQLNALNDGIATSTPEPTTICAMALGAGVLLLRRRRRN